MFVRIICLCLLFTSTALGDSKEEDFLSRVFKGSEGRRARRPLAKCFESMLDPNVSKDADTFIGKLSDIWVLSNGMVVTAQKTGKAKRPSLVVYTNNKEVTLNDNGSCTTNRTNNPNKEKLLELMKEREEYFLYKYRSNVTQKDESLRELGLKYRDMLAKMKKSCAAPLGIQKKEESSTSPATANQ